MGCEVQKTDTGVEVDIHRFDSKENAQQYLAGRRYKYERHETWGLTSGIDFYQGQKREDRASLREKIEYIPGHGSWSGWSVAFWKAEQPVLRPPIQVVPPVGELPRNRTEIAFLFAQFKAGDMSVVDLLPLEDVADAINFRLGVRVCNALKNEGIFFVSELCEMTKKDLYKIRYFGKGSLNIVREFLDKINRRLVNES